MKSTGHHVLWQFNLNGIAEVIGSAATLDKHFHTAKPARCARPTYSRDRIGTTVLAHHSLNLAEFDAMPEDFNLRVNPPQMNQWASRARPAYAAG